MEIRSKAEFYKLWQAGVLGNRTQLFTTLKQAMDSGAPTVGFREIGRAGGGMWERSDTRQQIPEIHARWLATGRPFIMDDGVPNNRSTMQGEICRTHEGLQGYIATGYALLPMRRTMAAGLHKHYSRLEVRLLQQRYMDPSSREDIDALLDIYPDATVEFTCFDVNVGNIPNRNTMIWEVRNY